MPGICCDDTMSTPHSPIKSHLVSNFPPEFLTRLHLLKKKNLCVKKVSHSNFFVVAVIPPPLQPTSTLQQRKKNISTFFSPAEKTFSHYQIWMFSFRRKKRRTQVWTRCSCTCREADFSEKRELGLLSSSAKRAHTSSERMEKYFPCLQSVGSWREKEREE